VNVSGRISVIEIDPTDPNKVCVGAAQGGVYRSLDGGTTWTAIFRRRATLAMGTLNLDPINGWLWVGMGEANWSSESFAGAGLSRIENDNTTANLVGPIQSDTKLERRKQQPGEHRILHRLLQSQDSKSAG